MWKKVSDCDCRDEKVSDCDCRDFFRAIPFAFLVISHLAKVTHFQCNLSEKMQRKCLLFSH